jgi:hypothetical protein
MTTLGSLAIALFLPALTIALSYIGSCIRWPFGTCRTCQGHGLAQGLFGGIRVCRACDGTGLRLRLGRRLINAIRRLHNDSNR